MVLRAPIHAESGTTEFTDHTEIGGEEYDRTTGPEDPEAGFL